MRNNRLLIVSSIVCFYIFIAGCVTDDPANENSETLPPGKSVQSTNGFISGAEHIYKINARENTKYIVELYNVEATLLGDAGRACSGTWANGLALLVKDKDENEISKQCVPQGSGNVHNIMEFESSISGTHEISVFHNNEIADVSGKYEIRIVPKYDVENMERNVDTQEPNDRAILAFPMEYGSENLIASSIEKRLSNLATNLSDSDWFSVSATAGESYVIEILDVEASLTGEAGRACSGAWSTGIALLVEDVNGNEIARQCLPEGSGTVHNIIEFEASVSGLHYVRVFHNNQTELVSGSYKIRALSKHKSETSTWSTDDQEPNNRALNSFPMSLGMEKFLLTNIDKRTSNLATNLADIDWFNFEASMGDRYVIEIYDVDVKLLGDAGRACSGVWANGLALLILDASGNEISRQCVPQGSGSVHNIIEFEADVDGFHYIKVFHNNAVELASGDYKIRILPKYDDEELTNAVDYEPNNRALNALQILLGSENSISTTIEKRATNLATNLSDIDWFYFNAIAGESYVTEIYDLESKLIGTAGRACSGAWANGLALLVQDDNGNEIGRQCVPLSSENIHNTIEFNIEENGEYFIKIFHNNASEPENGNYSLRVLEK